MNTKFDEIQEYFDLLEQDKSKHTIRRYKSALYSMITFFGIENIHDVRSLTPKLMVEYRKHLLDKPIKGTGKKLSKTSINSDMLCISAFFHFLIKKEYITKNPLKGVSQLKTGERNPIYFDNSEWEKMVSVSDLREKFLLVFMRATLLRRAELVNVKLSDIRDNYVTVIRKRDKQQRIGPLPVEVMNMMTEYLKTHKGEYLFTSTRGHHQLSAETIRAMVKNIATRAKLDPERIKVLTPHKIRHTGITYLLASGAGLKTVQAMAAHSNSATTLLYSHVVNEVVEEAFKNQKFYMGE
jgi:integrase/recombinase XerC